MLSAFSCGSVPCQTSTETTDQRVDRLETQCRSMKEQIQKLVHVYEELLSERQPRPVASGRSILEWSPSSGSIGEVVSQEKIQEVNEEGGQELVEETFEEHLKDGQLSGPESQPSTRSVGGAQAEVESRASSLGNARPVVPTLTASSSSVSRLTSRVNEIIGVKWVDVHAAAADGLEDGQQEMRKRCKEVQHERKLTETTWDLAFLIGIPCIKKRDSCLLGTGLMATILLELVLVGGVFYLVDQGSVITEVSADELLGSLRRWRLSDGHASGFADTISFASLASRVCAGDKSLSIAPFQGDLLETIDKYLEHFAGIHYLPCGLVLTITVVGIWTLIILAEVVSAFEYVAAVLELPVEKSTLFTYNAFVKRAFKLQSITAARRGLRLLGLHHARSLSYCNVDGWIFVAAFYNPA